MGAPVLLLPVVVVVVVVAVRGEGGLDGKHGPSL